VGFDPEIEAPDQVRMGDFANAIRIGSDSLGCFLDFMSYSEREETALVVSRIRVRQGFLPLIRDRISENLSI